MDTHYTDILQKLLTSDSLEARMDGLVKAYEWVMTGRISMDQFMTVTNQYLKKCRFNLN